jgi:Holliday junction resolvasome RuvABC endonuclease subunit
LAGTLTLALDLGSRSGFATMQDGHVSYGWVDLKVGTKFHPSGYLKLFNWVESMVTNGHVLDVVVEKPHASQMFKAVEILFGLLAVVYSVCDKHQIPIRTVSPMTIKKFWTGTGKSDKKAMVKKTQEMYPAVVDHNVSDAIALLHYHLETK